MAKAADTTSKIDCWLRDALELAVAALGTKALAKERLLEWLEAGKLPWDCEDWKALDEAGIAKLKREHPGAGSVDEYGNVRPVIPSAAYDKGDPRFWGAQPKIDWEDNAASELAMKGARARGIKVSRTHLLALLPEATSEHEKISDPAPTKVKRAASGARKTASRLGPQMRRALPVLKELYPPDGWAPGNHGTEFVRGLVNTKLSDDSQNQGLGDVSWETINRLLGRDPDYPADRLRDL